jgi:uncharacterized surface protein with fasciclin (FAS1) repeats
MTHNNSAFKKVLMGVVGFGMFTTLAACNQPQATSEAPSPVAPETAPETDTALSPATEAPQSVATADETVESVISDTDSFSILEEAINTAELGDTLGQPGPYTIFAPTDAAFQALPPETLEALQRPENKATLQQILSYHVVPTAIPSAEITPGEVETVAGESVNIATAGGQVTVGDATVTQPDIQASNGVIHAIDKVLLPPDLQL